MSVTYDLIFRRGTIVNHDGIGEADRLANLFTFDQILEMVHAGTGRAFA